MLVKDLIETLTNDHVDPEQEIVLSISGKDSAVGSENWKVHFMIQDGFIIFEGDSFDE